LSYRLNGNVGNKLKLCTGLANDEESFYSQNKRRSPKTDFKKSHSHRALGMGENIWFRIFTGTKTGPKWKRGVVIG
jgi:hypothetical protein